MNQANFPERLNAKRKGALARLSASPARDAEREVLRTRIVDDARGRRSKKRRTS